MSRERKIFIGLTVGFLWFATTMFLKGQRAEAHDCFPQAAPESNCYFEAQYNPVTGEVVSVYVCQ